MHYQRLPTLVQDRLAERLLFEFFSIHLEWDTHGGPDRQ